MGQIYYSFDPTKGICEVKDLFDLLHKYYPEIPEDPSSFSEQKSSIDLEKDRAISELNELIKKYQEDGEKNDKELDSLREKLKETEASLKTEQEEGIKYIKLVKKLNEEKDQLQTDFKNEINKIKEEKETEINSLNKQIESYVKKLAIYEPTLNGDTGNDKFFNIDGSNLQETFSSDAPFVGKVDAEGNAIFTFNVEKGSHKYYAQNASELENFCEIIVTIEGANHIGIDKWGEGKFHNNGSLYVNKKAKIKLVKE